VYLCKANTHIECCPWSPTNYYEHETYESGVVQAEKYTPKYLHKLQGFN
jgi:hypothetical protein